MTEHHWETPFSLLNAWQNCQDDIAALGRRIFPGAMAPERIKWLPLYFFSLLTPNTPASARIAPNTICPMAAPIEPPPIQAQPFNNIIEHTARLPTATFFSFISLISLRIFQTFLSGLSFYIPVSACFYSDSFFRIASLPDGFPFPSEKYFDSTMLRLFFYLLFSDSFYNIEFFCYPLIAFGDLLWQGPK